MSDRSNRVCLVEKAGNLDRRIRRWWHNPRKMLSPYIKEGMTVLDFGCGPGFFSIDMAKMVGKSGRVIACDLQEGMLDKVKDKISGTEFEERTTLCKCKKNEICVMENVDFVLAFYVVHEVPSQEQLFHELKKTVKHDGQIFIVEPPFHVSKKAFEETVLKATDAGFTDFKRPGMFLSKAVILKNG